MAITKVAPGDTGIAIAGKLGTTFDTLAAANPGTDWNNLQIGQELQIPGGGGRPAPASPEGGGSGQRYSVVAGDTGFNIAQKFGISFEQLSAANPGINWDVLAVGQVLSIPSAQGSGGGPAAPRGWGIPAPRFDDSGTAGGGPVRQYSGPPRKFPNPANWQRWSAMWARNSAVMRINNSPQEIDWIEEAINTVAREAKVDRRIILAMIMQESQGNVRVPTTNNGVRNPGLMQSHNGVSFDPGNPRGSIFQMIRDGVLGTASGDGLVQLFNRYGDVYAAFRGYNSGSVDFNNLNNAFTSTPSYVSDMANRLMGAPPN